MTRFRPSLEGFEDRCLPALTLDPVANVSLPAGKSVIVPLTATDTDGDPVNYTVMSDNAAVTGTVLTGPFVRLTLASPNPALNGQVIDIQMFPGFAPANVQRFTDMVTAGFYNGLSFYRIVPGFVIQGGNLTGTGNRFADEYNPAGIFTGTGQLAFANSGDDTNDSEFFITTTTTTPAQVAQQRALDFNFTLLGQVVRGQGIVDLVSQQPAAGQSATPPITIQTAQVVTNTSDASLLITATGAATANLTVTADDGPGGDAPSVQMFSATAAADVVNDPPFLGPVANQTTTAGTPVTFTLTRTDLENDPPEFQAVLQGGSAANATVTVAGNQVTVTPNAGFVGTLSLKVGVKDQGATFRGNDSDPFDTQLISVQVTAAPPPVDPPSPDVPPGVSPPAAGPDTAIPVQPAVPPSTPAPDPVIVSGAGSVTVFNPATGTQTPIAAPFGGVPANAAVGDLTGDGVADYAFVPGAGGGPVLTLVNGATGAPIASVAAFASNDFRGGLTVAVGTGVGGRPVVAIGAGVGGGPFVRVFDATTMREVVSLFAFDPTGRLGARVAFGDVTGDGVDDLIVGSGPGAEVQVVVIDGTKLGQVGGDGMIRVSALVAGPFAPFPGFAGPITLASGNLDGDKFDDLVVAPGAGGGAVYAVYAGRDLVTGNAANPAVRPGLPDGTFRGGLSVGAADTNADGRDEVLATPGAGAGPVLYGFDGVTGNMLLGTFVGDPNDRSARTLA